MKHDSEFSNHSMRAAFGCWVAFLLGPNVMVAATNANFMDALIKDFGASYSEVSGAIAIAPLVVAFLVPIAGQLIDRFGARRVLIPGVMIFAGAFLAMSQVISIWQYALLQIVLSVGASLNSSVGYAKVVSSWFDRNRGLVLGTCVAFGAGIGQMSMPKISQWLIDTYGWRGGYQGISLIIFAVALPLIFIFVRQPKGVKQTPLDHNKASDVKVLPGLSVPESLKTLSFYQVFFAIMFASMTLIGTLSHARILFEEHGFSANIATTAISLSFAGVLIGEFSSGFLVDRFPTPRIILPYFCIALLGVLISHTTSGSEALLMLGCLMMGMGLGGEIGQNAYMISRYFGLKSFGTLYGLTFGASNLGIAIGIFMMGKVHDLTGSYDVMVYIFGTTMTISVLCIATLGKFRFLLKPEPAKEEQPANNPLVEKEC
ncbi:MFS transporter [Alteromonas sp. NFXS44]|uniref:MFS transporter n=1 Tax=Alteromonas sp. NFXS44 TaxID=2818435 RepID=UPI0032E04F34